MTEFKKGVRVRTEKGWLGTVDSEVFHSTIGNCPAVYVRMKEGTGARTVKYLHNLTRVTDPAPLRFEDVRDGDTITVEGAALAGDERKEAH